MASSSSNSRTCTFHIKRDQETEPQQHALRKEQRKGKDSRSWMSKSSCSKGGKCSCEHDTAKKGQCKGNRSRISVKKRHFRRTTICQKDRKVHLEKKEERLTCSTTEREIVITIESVIIGIPCIANTSGKI